MELAGKQFLVVGASGALGGLIATELDARGAVVTGTTHKPVAGKFHQLLFDIADPVQVSALAARMEKLDGLVIASGLVGFGDAVSTSEEDHARLMSVNFEGPRQLITALTPKLAGGSVTVITGVVASRAFPGMSSYVASKSALGSWLNAYRMDVRGLGIQVLDARPGHTETGLANRPLFGVAPKFPVGLQPEHVARAVVSALENGEADLPADAFAKG